MMKSFDKKTGPGAEGEEREENPRPRRILILPKIYTFVKKIFSQEHKCLSCRDLKAGEGRANIKQGVSNREVRFFVPTSRDSE